MIFKPPQITERIPDVTSLGSPMPQKNNVFKAVVYWITHYSSKIPLKLPMSYKHSRPGLSNAGFGFLIYAPSHPQTHSKRPNVHLKALSTIKPSTSIWKIPIFSLFFPQYASSFNKQLKKVGILNFLGLNLSSILCLFGKINV